MIYLDHNSTTPLEPAAAAAMQPWLGERFGNPASQHAVGRQARQALEHARDEIGRILGLRLDGPQPDRLIFTSGGTEANNLALLGMAGAMGLRFAPGEAIVSSIEHPSVLRTIEWLEERGWTIHRLAATRSGLIELAGLDEWLHAGTRFVSVMLANNETGVVQPVAEIARRCARLGVPLHTDAAQAVGKLPVDFRALGASAMTVAPHKFHGPLGIGALVARHDLALDPLLFGGFQQQGLRPGTESIALAVGFHAALAEWQREGATRSERMAALRNRFEATLAVGLPGQIEINGSAAERLPQTSNVAFLGLDRQALFMALDAAGVACATGSACKSGSSEPSPVLVAMGCGKELVGSSLRFSLGAMTTAEEVDRAAAIILEVCRRTTTGKSRQSTLAR